MPPPMNFDIFGQDSKLENWIKTGVKYQGVVHLLGELFQNSIRNFNEHGVSKGKIQCNIDLQNKEFTVSDNGTGFTTYGTMGVNKSEWKDPNGGSGMGVGLKAVIANSNMFELETKFTSCDTPAGSKVDNVILKIVDFFDIANDQSLKEIQITKKLNKNGSCKPSNRPFKGTSIKVKFHNEIFNEFLEEYDSEDISYLFEEFYAQTPLGLTSSLFDSKPVKSKHKFSLKVVYTDGKSDTIKPEPLGFRIQNNISTTTWIAHDGIGKKHKTGTLPASEDILFYRKKGSPSKIDNLEIKVFAYCVNGKGGGGVAEKMMEDNFPSALANRSAADRIFLSINGYLQKFSPKTSADMKNFMTIQDWMIVVIDVNINVVEDGRVALLTAFDQRISKEIELVGSKFHQFLYKEAPKGASSTYTKAWVQQTTKQTLANPILQYKDNIAKQITKKDTVFLGTPKTEQEVVGLFVDLLSKKVIKDIKIFAITGIGTYDFLLQLNSMIATAGSNTFAIYKKLGAGLGSKYSDFEASTIAEAKIHAADVVPEFHKIKNAKDINHCKILICWDLGVLSDFYKSRYTIKIMPQTFKNRIHPSETHVLQRNSNPDNDFVGIICLKEFFK